jgi:hypothetical protein
MKFDPSFNQVAQWAHFQTGVLFILLGGGWKGCGALLAYASLKEFVWDRFMESPAVRGSDLEDWIWQMFGGFIGIVLYYNGFGVF